MFGLNANEWTAMATVVNAVVVVVLVIITFRYMQSAGKQAKASDEQAQAANKQAEAADKQAAAAFANIELLKEQIQSQAKLKLTETLIDLRRMDLLVAWWCPKLREDWGALTAFEPLLSKNSTTMVYVVEKSMPSQAENVRKIERLILNAETLVIGQLARQPNYRQADVMRAAANDLDEASVTLRAVLLEVDNVSRRAV